MNKKKVLELLRTHIRSEYDRMCAFEEFRRLSFEEKLYFRYKVFLNKWDRKKRDFYKITRRLIGKNDKRVRGERKSAEVAAESKAIAQHRASMDKNSGEVESRICEIGEGESRRQQAKEQKVEEVILSASGITASAREKEKGKKNQENQDIKEAPKRRKRIITIATFSILLLFFFFNVFMVSQMEELKLKLLILENEKSSLAMKNKILKTDLVDLQEAFAERDKEIKELTDRLARAEQELKSMQNSRNTKIRAITRRSSGSVRLSKVTKKVVQKAKVNNLVSANPAVSPMLPAIPSYSPQPLFMEPPPPSYLTPSDHGYVKTIE